MKGYLDLPTAFRRMQGSARAFTFGTGGESSRNSAGCTTSVNPQTLTPSALQAGSSSSSGANVFRGAFAV
jgi:hypothetical protein